MVGAKVPRVVSETSQTDRISGSEMFLEEKDGEMAVSYTHLTLPTKLEV